VNSKERIGPEELRKRAAEALDQSGLSQEEIAEELGRSRSSISRATNEAGAKFANLQCEIIELLTPFSVHEQTVYILEEQVEDH